MWRHDQRGCGMGCPGYTPCFSCPTGGCTTCPTTSCYQLQPQACFSIGTYLANYDSQQTAVINDIFDQLGGSSVNLTAVGYQGLANTYVTLNQLISASGVVLSPSTVMTGSLTAENLVTLFSDAVQDQQQSGMCSSGTSEQTNAEQALSALAGDLDNGPPSFQLCQLVSIAGSTCQSDLTSPPTYAQLSSGINVLQALTTAAELSNGTSGITVNVASALGLTGYTSASLALQVIQPAQIAYGPVGSVILPSGGCPPSSGTATCATTAQVSGTLTVSVGAYSAIAIPFTAATGTATFNFAACASNHVTTTLDAMTTTASSAVTIGGASLVTLNFAGASTTGFSYLDGGASGVVPPSASTDSGANPSNPKQLGTSSPTPTISNASGQWTTVGPLLAPLDAILGPILQAAGVTVGGANVADLGLDCDAIVPGP
jgi:uncharacterized membrane protein